MRKLSFENTAQMNWKFYFSGWYCNIPILLAWRWVQLWYVQENIQQDTDQCSSFETYPEVALHCEALNGNLPQGCERVVEIILRNFWYTEIVQRVDNMNMLGKVYNAVRCVVYNFELHEENQWRGKENKSTGFKQIELRLVAMDFKVKIEYFFKKQFNLLMINLHGN